MTKRSPNVIFPRHRPSCVAFDATRFPPACCASWARPSLAPSFARQIHTAIRDANAERVEHFLRLGGDPNGSWRGHPHLLFALRAPAFSERIFELLLAHGANVNVGYIQTPVMTFHSPQVLQRLIDFGANVNARDAFGRTALGLLREEIKRPSMWGPIPGPWLEMERILVEAGGTV